MFSLLDEARRQAGNVLGILGCGPQETPSRVVAEFDAARLRAYQEGGRNDDRPVLLLIPAPFKRHYIWDLMPGASVVRTCLHHGMRVYLLEWLLPRPDQDGLGLDDYADRLIDAACDRVAEDADGTRPIVAGHSLGGTFAAIYATLYPERVRGVVLVDAALRFGDAGDVLAREVAMAPPARWFRSAFGSPVPGSAITLLSTAGLPEVFLAQPIADRLASWSNSHAALVHIGVIRWTLDEFPMAGQLFEDVFEQLYRQDRLTRGTLHIGGRRAGIARLKGPVLAVVNPYGGVIPPASIHHALRLAPQLRSRTLAYESARGAALEHIGPLVSSTAHAQLWPQITRWAHERG